MGGGGCRRETGHRASLIVLQFSINSHHQCRGRARRQSAWGEQVMCRRAGSNWPERITQSCVWFMVANRPSPSCPIRYAGGRDIDNASKPVFCSACVCAGIDAVGWQPPEKSKRISASQTPRHQSRMSGPGHDRPGHRSGSRTTKSNNGEFSIEHVHTAASADAVLPSRHRHSRYMLCTTTEMYPMVSPQPG